MQAGSLHNIMVRDGIPYVFVPMLLALVLVIVGYWMVAIPLVLLAAFMAYFFRDPQRSVPAEAGVVVAPADGLVTIVRLADATNAESLISIFLSPIDVHINRSPIGGVITDIAYKKGKYLMATRAESRVLNEQNTLTIQGDGLTVKCTQIAGILARRIVCWKRAGDRVKCGERFGMIKFSSRTDVLLPPNVKVLVREGMRVRGGVTVVGRIEG
ncbi:MAG: phosphatidylserine decarboxylase [Blastocatellia bacterium]|jgi:phosphatidylserine decarboxylase|nr:phosphatidylserine decarboxylase [Blastocatellia bacterium]